MDKISQEELSKNSGVTKPTLTRYLAYLEVAFLIVQVRRIDDIANRNPEQRGS